MTVLLMRNWKIRFRIWFPLEDLLCPQKSWFLLKVHLVFGLFNRIYLFHRHFSGLWDITVFMSNVFAMWPVFHNIVSIHFCFVSCITFLERQRKVIQPQIGQVLQNSQAWFIKVLYFWLQYGTLTLRFLTFSTIFLFSPS